MRERPSRVKGTMAPANLGRSHLNLWISAFKNLTIILTIFYNLEYIYFKIKIKTKKMMEKCPICDNDIDKCTCEQDYEFYEPTTADLDDDE